MNISKKILKDVTHYEIVDKFQDYRIILYLEKETKNLFGRKQIKKEVKTIRYDYKSSYDRKKGITYSDRSDSFKSALKYLETYFDTNDVIIGENSNIEDFTSVLKIIREKYGSYNLTHNDDDYESKLQKGLKIETLCDDLKELL